jgi:hypothetical protein
MTAGVEIYERQMVVLHAKTMVVDARTSVVGSVNLDYRSIEYNCELSTIVRSAEFGRHIVAMFDNDVQYAKRIELAEWRKRPYADQFMQWAVSRARVPDVMSGPRTQNRRRRAAVAGRVPPRLGARRCSRCNRGGWSASSTRVRPRPGRSARAPTSGSRTRGTSRGTRKPPAARRGCGAGRPSCG